MNSQTIKLRDMAIRLDVPDQVMPPSPYSLFLAKEIPDLEGAVVADVGSGCGIQAIIAAKKGAKKVIFTENNPIALETTLHNARLNGVEQILEAAPCGDVLSKLPLGFNLDWIICNPASLPMPVNIETYSPYFSGIDGRWMIERLISQSEGRLKAGGTLLFVHTSLANIKESESLLSALGFSFEITHRKRLEFRSFYDIEWINKIGGTYLGLYEIWEQKPHETLYLVKATLTAESELAV